MRKLLISLILQLTLSRDNYLILRKALLEIGVDVLPSFRALQENKNNIIPNPIEGTKGKAKVGISTLPENTAA